MNKDGQVTIFIILALIIIGIVASYFAFREDLFKEKISKNFEGVYDNLIYCIEDDVLTGASVLESQGGYIELPEFEAGSEIFPFSSQLNFAGNPIPYWFYVSGNGIKREQVPSQSFVETELEDFIEKRIRNCIFDSYYGQGYEVNLGTPEADVQLREDEIVVDLDMDFSSSFGEDSIFVDKHKIVVSSMLGKLYKDALKVYEQEQEEWFLEKYAIDNLRLYSPVDGVELQCSPMVWDAEDVFDELEDAIEVNTLALKSKGEKTDYYVVDLNVGSDVSFVNSRNWERSFEVLPSEDSLLIASPIGNQQGLGALGFCYVPYHFVYNVNYPVLVQVSQEEEIFQFPMAVVIRGNNPRESLKGSAADYETFGLCEDKNTKIKVNVKDNNLNAVESEIYFECFGERCYMGETSSGILDTEFPQCVNGKIIAKSQGYEDGKKTFSTTEAGEAEIFLNKKYNLQVNLNFDKSHNYALVSFISDDYSKTVYYPEQKNADLIEGQYEIDVQIYGESSLNFDEAEVEQCIDVYEGLSGFFGFASKKCFDVEIPSEFSSNVLIGGGSQNYYVLESELKDSNSIEIAVESLETPSTLEELQNNYILIEDKNLEVSFA